MSFFLNPSLACDYYKIGHATKMQPEGMNLVYSTWTARSYKYHPGCPKTVIWGHKYTMSRLVEYFNENFFSVPLDELESEFNTWIGMSFNEEYADFSKFKKLWNLQYLPINVYGVPEGTLLPVGIPDHVIWNTHPDFAWLPQFIEDMWSANNWLPSTSATTAFYRRQLLRPYVDATCDNPEEAIDHMCGDFSLRGHTSLEAGYISGAGHLLSFDRTATIGSNVLLSKYYGTNYVPGMGTPSLEHSVVEQGIACFKNRLFEGDIPDYMRPYVKEAVNSGNWEINLIAEMCFILHLITEVQPWGVMTYVADTYDYWGVVSKVLPIIKDVIMKRDGCFSVRPDSGNPVKIICGDKDADPDSPEYKGTINCLMDIFGYGCNSKGCKKLPKQIAMIYGDAITPEITKTVGDWCVTNNIAINNMCFGIGAFTYQHVTRDTRGFAIKATYCEHKDYGPMLLYKQPKTDPGKKSPRGCVAVIEDGNTYKMIDNLGLAESLTYPGNIMIPKMLDGKVVTEETFSDVKNRLMNEEYKMEVNE